MMNRDSTGRLRHPAGAPKSIGGQYAPDNQRGGAVQAAPEVEPDSSEFAHWQQEHDSTRWADDPLWEQRNKALISSIDLEESEHRYEMTEQRVLSVPEFEDELRSYLGTQLWSAGEIPSEDGDDDEVPKMWGEEYSVDDFDDATLLKAREELAALLEEAPAAANEHHGVFSIGHDFALTRNHHGSGFWDRGTGEAGRRLSRAAEEAGPVEIALGPDGKLILE